MNLLATGRDDLTKTGAGAHAPQANVSATR